MGSSCSSANTKQPNANDVASPTRRAVPKFRSVCSRDTIGSTSQPESQLTSPIRPLPAYHPAGETDHDDAQDDSLRNSPRGDSVPRTEEATSPLLAESTLPFLDEVVGFDLSSNASATGTATYHSPTAKANSRRRCLSIDDGTLPSPAAGNAAHFTPSGIFDNVASYVSSPSTSIVMSQETMAQAGGSTGGGAIAPIAASFDDNSENEATNSNVVIPLAIRNSVSLNSSFSSPKAGAGSGERGSYPRRRSIAVSMGSPGTLCEVPTLAPFADCRSNSTSPLHGEAASPLINSTVASFEDENQVIRPPAMLPSGSGGIDDSLTGGADATSSATTNSGDVSRTSA